MLLLAWRRTKWKCHSHKLWSATTSKIIEQMWKCKKMCKIKKPEQKVWHEILEEPIRGNTKSRETTYQLHSQEDEWRQWIKLSCVQVVSILRCVVGVGESLLKLGVLSRGLPLSLFDILLVWCFLKENNTLKSIFALTTTITKVRKTFENQFGQPTFI